MDSDKITSMVDGTYLLPNERLTPDNIGMLKAFAPTLSDVAMYMQTVNDAIGAYKNRLTQKIVLNPADLQAYIDKIRTYTTNMGGGYSVDGLTKIPAQAVSIIPDILMNLRDNQLTLCQLYALYVDSQGAFVGPLDSVTIESTPGGTSL